MYHESNNLFFGRTKDGKVRIIKFDASKTFPDFNLYPNADAPKYADAILDVTIEEGPWCSAVASVSVGDEINGRWFRAMAFHTGDESYAEEAKKYEV